MKYLVMVIVLGCGTAFAGSGADGAVALVKQLSGAGAQQASLERLSAFSLLVAKETPERQALMAGIFTGELAGRELAPKKSALEFLRCLTASYAALQGSLNVEASLSLSASLQRMKIFLLALDAGSLKKALGGEPLDLGSFQKLVAQLRAAE